MGHLVGILILACMGCYVQVTMAQQQQRYILSTVLRIQCLSDNSFITIPPFGQMRTTAAYTSTTTPATTTTMAVTDPTSTPPPLPVVSVGGGANGDPESGNIRFWKVNWAQAVGNGTSVICASDPNTGMFRYLGWDAVLGLVVRNSLIFEETSDYSWKFASIFDQASWTYRYQLRNNNMCLSRMPGGRWGRITCQPTNAFYFNLLS